MLVIDYGVCIHLANAVMTLVASLQLRVQRFQVELPGQI